MSDDKRELRPVGDWDGQRIARGEQRDIELTVGESYSSTTVRIPVHVSRAEAPGPTVFVTAALHGDEINGTGAIRMLIQEDLRLIRGSLILVPVVNILAFDRHSRYLPDRRDLNRSFPGSPRGSQASRLARVIFDEIVARSDYGVDLHTAAVRRTNYPAVRGDMKNETIARMAKAFGGFVIMDGVGPKGAFRREACRAGCPTIIMEGGEVWKVESTIVESAVRGVKNVLRELGMLKGRVRRPAYQVTIERSKWIRAEAGGFLQFHVQPGDLVEKNQLLATNTNLLGRERNTLSSPFDGVVLGMTTLPAISPGEPVCHLGRLPKGTDLAGLERSRAAAAGLEERVLEDLGSAVMVVEPEVD
jgi:predicted deacylase